MNGQSKRSSISVEFSDLGFRVRSPGDLSDSELDATLDLLYNRVTDQELTQLMQLQNVFNGMSTVAFDSYSPVVNRPEEAERHSDELKLYVRDYFQRAEMDRSVKITDEQDVRFFFRRMNCKRNVCFKYHVFFCFAQLKDVPDDVIKGDVRTMMSRYPDNQFTGRTLARIFHGVASPVYPAQIWSRCQFWRQHTRIDFNRIVSLANALIVKART